METENWRTIVGWHLIDVLQESSMLLGIWNMVVELSDQLVEAIVWSEDLFLNPE
jgi:hypothetical protein